MLDCHESDPMNTYAFQLQKDPSTYCVALIHIELLACGSIQLWSLGPPKGLPEEPVPFLMQKFYLAD